MPKAVKYWQINYNQNKKLRPTRIRDLEMTQFKNLRKPIGKIFNVIIIILFSTLLFSCVSGSHIVVGDPRAATDPSIVKIYLEPPEKYETLGTVEASKGGGSALKRQKIQDKIINKLKTMAAKMGANGVLLNTSEDKAIGTSGGYYGGNRGYFGGTYGIYGSRVIEKRIAEGRAIYVIEEHRKKKEEYPKEQEENNNFLILYYHFKSELESDGYSIVTFESAALNQSESAKHTRTFAGGKKYRIICFSEDKNVLRIEGHIKRSDGEIVVKDVGRDQFAMFDYTPKVDREMQVVVKNCSSRTPSDKSKCGIIIASK